ncbi:tRNA (mnm(5)s(2)U34)-methyltransferase [Fimbriiglobus ruber]|uniref:Putative rRNA methylase n=1 Tax=Fimbriiglobus ruber TaxID=1908690 RepID=A0A225DZL8_9BACT|nr:class I SAM-dependent methyltransferase [Fimbriiglobus ruber]OWK46742.1 putative rRNA methylase [Fimbriiglobus ruber]
MFRTTELAQEAVRGAVRAGNCAIDATAGNGHDTVFLARMVGPAGVVFAVDIQASALSQTASRLSAEGIGNVTLLQCDHADLVTVIPAAYHGRVGAVMFNLGYLPGGGRAFVTKPESTARALRAAITLLRPGGVVTVIAYVGHPGGPNEIAAVESVLKVLEAGYEVNETRAQSETAPRLYVIKKGVEKT